EIEDRGASFHRLPRGGTLQVSASEKEHSPVDDADLRNFAKELGLRDEMLSSFNSYAFSGLTAAYEKDGFSYREWWLRHGRLLVYATYVTEMPETAEEEEKVVSEIVNSLRPTLTADMP